MHPHATEGCFCSLREGINRGSKTGEDFEEMCEDWEIEQENLELMPGNCSFDKVGAGLFLDFDQDEYKNAVIEALRVYFGALGGYFRNWAILILVIFLGYKVYIAMKKLVLIKWMRMNAIKSYWVFLRPIVAE